MAPISFVFFEPAVQHVGIHAVASRYGGNGSTRLLAGRHQLGFELACVGPVGTSGRISGKVWFFEHGVHDGLRAHDLARCETSIQDGFTGRLRANRRFADVLVAYHNTYPEVLVDMRLENRKIDLVADGYDLALRATRELSPALIARPICPVRFHLVATPAYLQREGSPLRPADLARCSAVVPNYVNVDGLEMQGPAGKARIKLHAVMRSDDSTLTYHAVHAGMGMTFLPEWTVGDDLAAGRLARVLPAYTLPPFTLYAVSTNRQYMTPKLRTFIDFFSESLGGGKSVA